MTTSPKSSLATHANCLAIGSRVAEFEIIDLIGEGGFGIVYLARDTTLDRIVALKEFMPAAFAGRIDGVRVAVRAANQQATFDAGLKSFINEAKLLARFAHPALVEVFRFWEGNGTAYTAMRLYKGETLRHLLSRPDEVFDEERIAQIMAPILDALEMLHREQIYHRDVAPDNIMLADGRSVLLDFGSARRIIGDATQALTTVLKPGYAPIEQYTDDGSMKQGPWTDVYAVGGVLYHMATGRAPTQAVSRLLADPMRPLRELAGDRYSEMFCGAVDHALGVHATQRFQTIAEFRDALGWNVTTQQRVITQSRSPATIQALKAATALPTIPPPQPEQQEAGESAAESEPPDLGPTSPMRSDVEPTRIPQYRSGWTAQKWKLAVAAIVALAVVALMYSMGSKPRPATDAPSVAGAQPADTAISKAGPAPTPAASVKEVVGANAASADRSATLPAPAPSAAPVGEGIVRFNIKPAARVDIDGITRGLSSSLKDVRLSAGKHEVEIIFAPDQSVKKTIEVQPNAEMTVSHTFQ